ncbi:hypothetical protein D3C81_957830 [compost metagenome]
MTVYFADDFSDAGPIAGKMPDVGGVPWSGVGQSNGSALVRTGAQINAYNPCEFSIPSLSIMALEFSVVFGAPNDNSHVLVELVKHGTATTFASVYISFFSQFGSTPSIEFTYGPPVDIGTITAPGANKVLLVMDYGTSVASLIINDVLVGSATITEGGGEGGGSNPFPGDKIDVHVETEPLGDHMFIGVEYINVSNEYTPPVAPEFWKNIVRSQEIR